MDVTVIGAGNMGRGLAHVLARGGHSVTIVDRAGAIEFAIREFEAFQMSGKNPCDSACSGVSVGMMPNIRAVSASRWRPSALAICAKYWLLETL